MAKSKKYKVTSTFCGITKVIGNFYGGQTASDGTQDVKLGALRAVEKAEEIMERYYPYMLDGAFEVVRGNKKWVMGENEINLREA